MKDKPKPECDYPWHPIRDTTLIAVEKVAGGENRHYKCPTCGAQASAHIADAVGQYGKS